MKHYVYPNTAPPGRSDWIEFIMDPAKDNPDGYSRLFRVNVSFMLSNWNCTFGSCPGILMSGAHTDISCCQIGVKFGLHEGPEEKWEEFKRVKQSVQELTPEDWDHGYGKDKADEYWATFRTWAVRQEDGNKAPQRVPDQTRVVKGGCVFANRHNGAAGKPGCAFHVLAQRTGRHHSDTKPDICWMIPFGLSTDFDEEIQLETYTVMPINASMWGPLDTSTTNTIGHWCTEIPDHYTGSQPVYKYAETELRKMLGNEEYERMAEELEGLQRRYPMPGEVVGGGRKLLPLLVTNRKKQWAAEENPRNANKILSAQKWLETNNTGEEPGTENA